MSSPAELRYTKEHEWARIEDDGTVTIGITDHAQDALGDVVFVELPLSVKTSRTKISSASLNQSTVVVVPHPVREKSLRSMKTLSLPPKM